MKEINLVQGSTEWLMFRKDHIGASEAATIMGLNPYSTPLILWGEKIGLIPEKIISPKMQRGKDLEEIARKKFSEQMKIEYIPKVGIHDDYDWMMASYDGIAEDGTIVEIKCNGPKWHAVTETGKVPPHHMPQLQHQLFVAGKDLGYYYSFDGSEGLTIEVKRNPEFIISMMEKEIEFWKCLEWMIPPM